MYAKLKIINLRVVAKAIKRYHL